jgi:hypothetical protein
MAIKLNDLKQRVAGFQKKAADLSPADPTEKGKVTPGTDVTDHPINNVKNAPAPQAVAGIPTKPAKSEENAPAAKDGNAEDKQVKAASGVDAAISKLKNLSKKAKSADSAPVVEAPAAAAQEELHMGPDALMKLASAIFETQEGIDAVLPVLRKKAGQEAAISLLKQASDEYENQVAEAVYMEKLAYAAAEQQYQAEAAIEEIVKSASSEEEANMLLKTAAQHIQNREQLGSELLKAAYDQSVEDAAEMAAAEEAGGEPALEGADGEPTIEQILMLLEQAVASGEITEEDAMMIAEALLSDEGGAEGEEMPAEEMPAEEMPKEASANRVNQILNYLNQ